RPVPGRPRATTPAENRFLALSARRRRTTTVPQLVADHFQASGRRISATTVRNRLHNAGLYARRPVVCVPLNGRQRRNRLCWARENVSWTQQQWASVRFTDESRFTMESDSGRLQIWREQRTRYHQSNTVERHSYRGGGILVWAGISLGGHTDLHVFHGGTVTGLRYRDEILDPYVRPYDAAIGNDFILMDENARPHRARIVEEYHGLERMEWPARSPDMNPIEHLWDYLGRGCCLKSSSRSLHELKQGLLCVWSSLPYSGVRQLNKQHGKSMPPMHSNPPILNLTFGPTTREDDVKEGANIYLECSVNSNPSIYNISWEFEDRLLSTNTAMGIIILNQTLILQKIRKEHQGRYSCSAYNSVGKGSSNTLYLLVQCKYVESHGFMK
ncbi:transposable element Tcb2 transposase, partial [Trichonephila clavipes]